MIDVILFDLGGVLVELTGVATMLEWTDNQFDADGLWEAWLNSPSVRSFETGCSTTEQFADEIIKEMNLPVGKLEFISAFRQWPRGLFPGATDVLNALKNQYTLACLSNSNELHWPRLMDEMGLNGMFEYYFASHITGKLKPDQDSFEHALQILGCDASSVLFLDDNAINVKSAGDIGMLAYKVAGPHDIMGILGETDIHDSRFGPCLCRPFRGRNPS